MIICKFKPQNCNWIVVQSRVFVIQQSYSFTKLNALNANIYCWIIVDQCSCHTFTVWKTRVLFQKADCSKNGQWNENYASVKVPCQDIICFVFITIMLLYCRQNAKNRKNPATKRHKIEENDIKSLRYENGMVDCGRQPAKDSAHCSVVSMQESYS